VRVANHFRALLDLPPSDTAIVSIARPGAHAALAANGIKVASRAGATRLSFHLYNDFDDAAAAADVVTASDQVGLTRDVSARVDHP
jgi:hypothetical protein